MSGSVPSVAATRKPERPHEAEPVMALKDRLTEKKRKPTGTPCSVGALLAELPKTEHDALHAMMYELGWSAHRIWETLRDEGHVVSDQQINRHRSQSCRCWKVEQ